jgi:uncharacterized protein (TIGR02466 family)
MKTVMPRRRARSNLLQSYFAFAKCNQKLEANAMEVQVPKVKVKKTELEHQFVTSLMSRYYEGVEELNKALSKLMFQLEKQARNVASETSNVGGFHTDNEFLSREEPEVQTLKGMIRNAVEEYMPLLIEQECSSPPQGLRANLWGWGINMRAGDSNTSHVHPNAKISGVYYVSVPPLKPDQLKAAKPEGSIMFYDPRPRANMNRIPNQISEIVVPPEPGMMILFPSYHEHSVLPFRSQGVRTCVAFNVQF